MSYCDNARLPQGHRAPARKNIGTDLWSEVCVTWPKLPILEAGHDLCVAEDCCGATAPAAQEATLSHLPVGAERTTGRGHASGRQKIPNSQKIDLAGCRVIPGPNDAHLPVIRGGQNFNMERRRQGVPSPSNGAHPTHL
jgi:hypothetical protein